MLEVVYDKNLDLNDFYRLFTWYNRYNQREAYKKEIYKKLMPIAWHPLWWRDLRMPEYKKKKLKTYGIIRMVVSRIDNTIKFRKIKLLHK